MSVDMGRRKRIRIREISLGANNDSIAGWEFCRIDGSCEQIVVCLAQQVTIKTNLEHVLYICVLRPSEICVSQHMIFLEQHLAMEILDLLLILSLKIDESC